MQLFEHPDVAGEIEFPPFQPMRCAARFGVMVIVVAFANRTETNPEVVFAFIRRLEGAIAELLHVADRVHRPGAIVDDQNRHVETPEHPGEPKSGEEDAGDGEMREHVERGIFPKFAIQILRTSAA